MGHARAVAAVSGAEKQLALARKIVVKGLSVRQAEQLAANETNKTPRKKAPRPAKDPHLQELEDRLRRQENLGGKNGQGNVVQLHAFTRYPGSVFRESVKGGRIIRHLSYFRGWV